MTFGESIRTVLSKYATFSGRATRPEFWWWFLFAVIVGAVTNLIDAAVIAPALGFEPFQKNAGQPLSMIVGLALLLPGLAVGVRRLHDTGRSGWWILINLVLIIGTIVYLYFVLQPSEEGENQYG